MTFAGLLQSGMIQETVETAALRYDLNETLTVFRSGCDWVNIQGSGLLLPVSCQRSTGRDHLIFDLSGCQTLLLWMREQSQWAIQSLLAAVAVSLNELMAAAYLNAELIALDFQHIYVSETDGQPLLLCLPLCLVPSQAGDPGLPLSLLEQSAAEYGIQVPNKRPPGGEPAALCFADVGQPGLDPGR